MLKWYGIFTVVYWEHLEATVIFWEFIVHIWYMFVISPNYLIKLIKAFKWIDWAWPLCFLECIWYCWTVGIIQFLNAYMQYKYSWTVFQFLIFLNCWYTWWPLCCWVCCIVKMMFAVEMVNNKVVENFFVYLVLKF